jgi:hypothetical protein
MALTWKTEFELGNARIERCSFSVPDKKTDSFRRVGRRRLVVTHKYGEVVFGITKRNGDYSFTDSRDLRPPEKPLWQTLGDTKPVKPKRDGKSLSLIGLRDAIKRWFGNDTDTIIAAITAEPVTKDNVLQLVAEGKLAPEKARQYFAA